MSKYYKVEDVIDTLADQWHFEAIMEYPDTAEDIEEWKKVARELFADLPTIEVSSNTAIRIVENECFRDDLSKEIKDYLFSDLRHKLYSEQAEVSEDCISREEVRAKLDYISYAEKDPITIAKRIVDNAPSVVPSRAEGEWVVVEMVPLDNYMCSKCGAYSGFDFNYCPHCGAKMKGAEE